MPPPPAWAFGARPPAGRTQYPSLQGEPVAQGQAGSHGEWAVSGRLTADAPRPWATGAGGQCLPFPLQVGEGTVWGWDVPRTHPSSLLLPKVLSFLQKKPEMSLFGASARPRMRVGGLLTLHV